MRPSVYWWWIHHFFLRLVDEFLLLAGDVHVRNADRDAGAHGKLEADLLEIVDQENGAPQTELAVAFVDQFRKFFFVHVPVDGREGHAFGQNVAEKDPADRGFFYLAVHAHPGARMDINHALVIGDTHFIPAREYLAFPLGAGTGLGEIIAAEHNVL